MFRRISRLGLRVVVLGAVLLAVVPLTASGASTQEQASFTVVLTNFTPNPLTPLGGGWEQLHYAGGDFVGETSDPTLFNFDAGMDVIFTVNPQKQLGTVAGTLMVTAFDVVGDSFVRWDGRLTGRVTPDGIGGVVHLKASTGQTFSGTWVSLSSLSDIIQDVDVEIAVTGTVRK